MAGNSVIGALRVDLGLNSAQFTAGLQKAQAGLGAFGKAASIGLAAVATAAVAASAALGVAVKGAIDHADALNKASQKAGVTVEALSRLEYAAKLSDVSLDGLTGGLEKLSKSMASVAAGTGPVAAFKALGISVTDAVGHLRGSADVFADVADRFSRMEDGATKTALAIQIFGKSGAELIPLLNSGAVGLKNMADESDRLGQTIGGKTAQQAEKFNDTLTRIGAEIGGLVNMVTADFLPVLQQIADWFTSPELVASIDGFVKSTVTDFQTLVAAANQVAAAIKSIGDAFNAVGALFDPNDKTGASPYTGADYNNAKTMAGVGLKIGAGAGFPTASDLYKGFGFGANGQMSLATPSGSATSGASPFTPSNFTASSKAIKTWSDEVDGAITRAQKFAETIAGAVTGAFSGFIQEIEQGTNPLKAFADQLADIGNQLLNAGIQSLISSIFTPNFIGGTFGAPALQLGYQVGVPHRALGGPVNIGQPYKVGERGPETFIPDSAGMIVPNGGGGASVVQVSLDPGLIASVLQQSKTQTIQIVKSNSPAAVAKARGNNQRG